MADKPIPFNKSWQAGIIIGTVVLCWILIGAIVWKGDPHNSLHSSALAWAFTVNVGAMAGLGFGTAVQYLPSAKS